MKNSRMAHPKNEEIDIVYASLEGPEAAAYCRGTAKLENGQARIDLPEHFRIVASEQSITVMITPLSAESKGIAVTKKGRGAFSVKEMFQGEGNYEFDWEVKAIRQGYENFKVYAPKWNIRPNEENSEEAQSPKSTKIIRSE